MPIQENPFCRRIRQQTVVLEKSCSDTRQKERKSQHEEREIDKDENRTVTVLGRTGIMGKLFIDSVCQ